MTNDRRTGVLLLAYGTPERLDDVEPYFTHIRGGRRPSPAAVAHLRRRYELVGGRTPLLDVTRQAARRLERRLNAGGDAYRVFVAMRHWHPFIADVIPQLAADGVGRVIAMVLAPHYSRLSIAAYRSALGSAMATLAVPPDVTFIDAWGSHPVFVDLLAGLVRAGMEAFPAAGPPVLPLFSAHSLPRRVRDWDDPYEAQLHESCAAVARRAGLSQWRFAWQSAGDTGEPWLGPDIVDYLGTLHAEGVRRVLSVPIGFVSEHLEVLYDIDIEAQQRAHQLGLTLRRITMPNASPALVEVLAALVRDAEQGALGTPLAEVEEASP